MCPTLNSRGDSSATKLLIRFSFRSPSRPGTVRIFVFGESAAFGTPDPAYSFSRILELMLQAQYPQTRFEVINTAIMGINSHAIRPIVAECAARDPDLFIFYMGNNEAVGFSAPGPESLGLAENLSLIRASLWLNTTRTGQLLSRLLRGKAAGAAKEPQDAEFFRRHFIAADDPPPHRHLRQLRGEPPRHLPHCATCGRADHSLNRGREPQGPTSLGLVASRRSDGGRNGRLGRGVRRGLGRRRSGTLRSGDRPLPGGVGDRRSFCRSSFPAGTLLLRRLAIRQGPRALSTGLRLGCDAFSGRPAAEPRDSRVGPRMRPRTYAWSMSSRPCSDCPASDHGIPGESLFFEHVHFRFAGNYEVAKAMFPAVSTAVAEILKRPAPRRPWFFPGTIARPSWP